MNPPTSGPVAAPPLASQLANTLTDALVRGEAALRSLAGATPPDRRDRVATLLTIYDLHTAPLETVRAVARWQGHPRPPTRHGGRGSCEAPGGARS